MMHNHFPKLTLHNTYYILLYLTFGQNPVNIKY